MPFHPIEPGIGPLFFAMSTLLSYNFAYRTIFLYVLKNSPAPFDLVLSLYRLRAAYIVSFLGVFLLMLLNRARPVTPHLSLFITPPRGSPALIEIREKLLNTLLISSPNIFALTYLLSPLAFLSLVYYTVFVSISQARALIANSRISSLPIFFLAYSLLHFSRYTAN